ncbi:hypothetical protein T492DRAFT_896864 [Pavlovales sp. CCMP2436]|nr:hypothetical protein T492DRAFT_896864 [Pavlovales sp. CCMP2436]
MAAHNPSVPPPGAAQLGSERRFDEAGLTPIIGRYVVPRGEPPAVHLEGGRAVLHSAELCDGA